MRTKRRHTKTIPLIAAAFFITALFSSGIFFICYRLLNSVWAAFFLTPIFMAGLLSAGCCLYNRRPFRNLLFQLSGRDNPKNRKPTDKVKPVGIDTGDIDRALTGRIDAQLDQTIRSITRNSTRLFALEERLSSQFRPRNSGDSYTRQLIFQLKICTSRLKNDLSEIACYNQTKVSEQNNDRADSISRRHR